MSITGHVKHGLIETLFQWPQALEKLHFAARTSTYTSVHIDEFEELLCFQEHSLRHLEISAIDRMEPGGRILNAGLLPNLEYLQLRTSHVTWEKPLTVAEALFGGSLRTLVIECEIETTDWPFSYPIPIDWITLFLQEVDLLPPHPLGRRTINLKYGDDIEAIERLENPNAAKKALLENLRTMQSWTQKANVDFQPRYNGAEDKW